MPRGDSRGREPTYGEEVALVAPKKRSRLVLGRKGMKMDILVPKKKRAGKEGTKSKQLSPRRTKAASMGDEAVVSPPDVFGSHEQTVADILKAARLEKNLTLHKISQELRIRESYLSAIESDNNDRLPEAVYTLGFIRSYAEFMGLNGETMVTAYKDQQAMSQNHPELSDLSSHVSERSVPSGLTLLASLILLAGAVTLGWLMLHDDDKGQEATGASLQQESPTALPSGGHNRGSIGAAVISSAPTNAGLPSNSLVSGEKDSTDLSLQEGQESPPQDTQGHELLAVKGPGDSEAAVPAPAPAPETGGVGAPVFGDSAVLTAAQRAWVRVQDGDGKVIVDHVLQVNEQMELKLGAGYFLSTGNVGVLRLESQGRQYPLIGKIGEVKRNIPLDPETITGYIVVDFIQSHP